MAGDHIQIPKSILERFSDKQKKIYAMDINKKIEHKLISEVNTKIGYYNEYVEKYVLKKREDAFGIIRKTINAFLKGKGTIELSKKNNDIIIDYFCITIFRSEETIKEMEKQSVAMKLIDGEPQNIIFSFYDRCISEVKKNLSNLYFNILENTSSIDFVIPQKQFYHCIQEGGTVQYIMPISPRLAITLNTNIEKYIVDDKVLIQKVKTDEHLDILNIMAIKDEFKENKKMVYAKKQETLERYVNCY